jgi:predicted 3-demethylubiquinone-9 3-methyltransferase (glyoxalase superfamily)
VVLSRSPWLKDKYGLSRQIVPTVRDEIMKDKDPEKLARMTEAFLRMKSSTSQHFNGLTGKNRYEKIGE